MASYPMQILRFPLPVAPATTSDQINVDKARLRERILTLRAQGMSYRQIAREVGIHWTRVGQIMKSNLSMPED